MRIFNKLKEAVVKQSLFAPDDTLLLAYSGGLDSTGLLLLLIELQKEWPIKLFLGHFNHKIRPRSDDDERFVRKMAAEKSLAIFTDSADVPSFAREQKLNLEEAGRILRYEFLERTAGQIGKAKIATGHTMTDQAETLLMHLLRGSGLKGLSGIFPACQGVIIRPLLTIEREEIRAYLEERGVAYCRDESNQDPSFFRNRIRMELLPFLRENFDPKIVPHLSRLASIVREDERTLENLTEEASRGVFVRRGENISLDMRSLSFLPLALQRRVVRHFLLRIQGNLRGISFNDSERIREVREGGELQIPGGLVLKREQGLLAERTLTTSEQEYVYSWSGEEELVIRELRVAFAGKTHFRSASVFPRSDDRLSVSLDKEKLSFPLKIRKRAEGDRYQPLGAPGRKKLKEIMRAKGIPLSERDAHPVFLSEEEIVWVLGLPVSERHKVTGRTRQVFTISLHP